METAGMRTRRPGAVMITGCSSGIGEACAYALSELGWRVFAGVRRPADAQRLQEQSGGRVEPVLLDVTDAEAIQAACGRLQSDLGEDGLGALVNNAGIVVPGPLELLSTEEFDRQLQVNVLGAHAVTRALLPLLRRAAGRIIFVGSISGRIAPPYYGAYAASKHALEAMADAWRMELVRWGIRVSIVEPDAVATPIWNKFDASFQDLDRRTGVDLQGLYEPELGPMRAASLRAGRAGMPVAAVVRAIQHAVCAQRPRTHYPVGWRTRLAFWAKSNLPAPWLDWFLRRAMGLR